LTVLYPYQVPHQFTAGLLA